MTNSKSSSKPASAKLFFWSLTAALAGFLFGFDTVVISGAEQTIQDLWGLSSTMHGLAMSAALLTLFFPSMVTAFEPGVVFGFFCFMMVLQLLWVKIMVPETKGRPLEDIEHGLGATAS